MNKAGAVKNILMLIVLLVAFGFIGHQLWTGWEALAQFQWEFSPLWLLLSFALVGLNFAMSAFAYQVIVQKLGQPIRYKAAFSLLYTANLGRYVPGKVWLLLGQAYLAERAGMKRAPILAATAYHLVLGLIASMLLASLLIAFGVDSAYSLWVLATATVVMAAVVILAPAQTEMMMNWALKKVGRDPISLTLDRKTAALVTGWWLLAWLAGVGAFAAAIASVTAVPFESLPGIAAAYILSYLAGFFAFFIPAGIGVREGLLTAMLPKILAVSGSVAGALAILFRLIVTGAEIAAFVIARLIKIGNPSKD